jgi:hypothetical protein
MPIGKIPTRFDDFPNRTGRETAVDRFLPRPRESSSNPIVQPWFLGKETDNHSLFSTPLPGGLGALNFVRTTGSEYRDLPPAILL